MEPFKLQLRSRGWYFTKRDQEEHVRTPTHTLMDGGILAIAPAELPEFHRVYADATAAGQWVYVVALKTRVFRMFFDFDCHVFDPPDDVPSWCASLTKLVCATLRELFGDSLAQPLHALTSVAELKQTRKGQQDAYKVGVHVNVPDLHVDRDMALRVRAALVQKLTNNFEKSGPTDWADDVDEAVYNANGLRMLYSRKCRKCRCALRERDTCQLCNGSGTVDEGRPYVPLLQMRTDDFTTSPMQGDALTLVERTRVQSELDAPSHAFNASPPSWFEDPFSLPGELTALITPARPGGGGKRARTGGGGLREGIDQVEGQLRDKIPLSTADVDRVLAWVQAKTKRGALPKAYRTAAVLSAFSFTTNGVRSHAICRLDSRYCINIGREHTTNTVYIEFNIVTKRAYMKCYCRCETVEGRRATEGRLPVMCKNFRSDPIPADVQFDMCATAARPKALALL